MQKVCTRCKLGKVYLPIMQGPVVGGMTCPHRKVIRRPCDRSFTFAPADAFSELAPACDKFKDLAEKD